MRLMTGMVVWLLVSAFCFKADEPPLIHRLIVLPASTMVIHGSTNVSKFTCSILRYSGTDTLVLQEDGIRKPVFLKGGVALKAGLFDCGMKMMTQDFISTIKAKTYPEIVINFISLEKIPSYRKGMEQFNGTLYISMAGTRKIFDVVCSIQVEESGILHLRGGRNFLFKDFNLQPPQKMMGLVKIDEQLQVNFDLVLRLDPDR